MVNLLSIVELGGYPDFRSLYQTAGFDAQVVVSMRKGLSKLKKKQPQVLVAEYNFQSDFHDRSSNLETLLSVTQRYPEMKLIIFYDKHHQTHFDALMKDYQFHQCFSFPIDEKALQQSLQNISAQF